MAASNITNFPYQNQLPFEERAKFYTNQIIPVFPCNKHKKPLTRNGFHDASFDPADIKAWSETYPAAFVGVPCGPASGIFTLDLDRKEGKPDGVVLFASFGIPIPPTRTYKTMSGGVHYQFKYPKGVRLGCTSGGVREDGTYKGLGPGIDTRGEGGYIIAHHVESYSVVENPDILADIPQELLDRLLALENPNREAFVAREDYTPPKLLNMATIGESLKVLDASVTNDPWVEVGFALHYDQGGSEEAFQVFEEWSKLGSNYKEGEAARRWPTMKWGGKKPPVTAKSLIKAIRDAGGVVGVCAASIGDFEELPDTNRVEFEESIPYGGGDFKRTAAGVWFIGNKVNLRVCGWLRAVAMARGSGGEDWGLLLEWRDADGVLHRWSMPANMRCGDGSAYREELLRMGLDIASGKTARGYLDAYLAAIKPAERVRCVNHLGWFEGRYITPQGAIGGEEDEEQVVFQSESAISPAFSVEGTIDSWKDEIGRFAIGNSRIAFAISVALAGPLLALAGEDGGGFHLRGASSSGKTTALRAAASVWGKPRDYVKTWRATANGLEGVAAVHNDGCLILDELSEVEAKEAGAAAYMLANGRGKARANKVGGARKSASWLLMLLSAGEESLSSLMLGGGRSANAGQELRLADIPADAGAGMGLFESLHGEASPGALAERMTKSISHGAVGEEWLGFLVRNREQVDAKIKEALRTFPVPPDAGGQVRRVARRFAVAAAAGELASEAGLTGWGAGEATTAADKCFRAWYENSGFGAGNREETRLLSHVRAFFEEFGASRFDRLDPNIAEEDETPEYGRIANSRVGFRKHVDGSWVYMVLPEMMATVVLKGFEPQWAIGVLGKAGWLERDEKGQRWARVRRLDGKSQRVYVMTDEMWA